MKNEMTNYERIFQDLGELKSTTVAILEQTKKTNGRVTALEGRVGMIEKDEAYNAGESNQRAITKKDILAFLSLLVAALALIFR